MENIANNALRLAEKCKCYKDVVISLDNGRADNLRHKFTNDVCNLDCNSKWFYNNLETVCDKHRIQ